MTTKPAFPALGAPMLPATAHGSPHCRGFGIAKILKMRQLHTRQGCNQVDAGIDTTGKNAARAAAEGRFPVR